MLSRRIKDGLLSAIRDEVKEQAVKVAAESKNNMLEEKTESKSPAVGTESKIAVKLVQDVNKSMKVGAALKKDQGWSPVCH